MIDWKIKNGKELTQAEGWFFPNFEVQELLLPQINVGYDYIDEYSDTTFDREDCFRMKKNIAYLMDSHIYTERTEIRFDTFNKGIVTIQTDDIQTCLIALDDALDIALKSDGCLCFYGD